MRIVECKQGTAEWFAAKRGKPSASNFSRIMTPGKRKLSAQAVAYADELIADLHSLTPYNIEAYTSRAMQNGIDVEPEARRWYSVERDVDVRQVGTCISDDGRFAASVDGLVGEDGALELKVPLMKTQVGYLLNGGVPDEYLCQCHGALVVTGREWIDFMSYTGGGLPIHLVRVTPNDFTIDLRVTLEQFWDLFQERLERFRKVEERFNDTGSTTLTGATDGKEESQAKDQIQNPD